MNKQFLFLIFLISESLIEVMVLFGVSFMITYSTGFYDVWPALIILSLIAKNEWIMTQKSWISHIILHRKSVFLLCAVLLDILLTGLISGFFFIEQDFFLWVSFIMNILLVKNLLFLLTLSHCSALLVRSLSCVVFAPWFILLQSALNYSSTIEPWIFCGSFFTLLVFSTYCVPIWIQWMVIPFEWSIHHDHFSDTSTMDSIPSKPALLV